MRRVKLLCDYNPFFPTVSCDLKMPVPPYPRFYNYDPKQNRRSIIHRNPYIPRDVYDEETAYESYMNPEPGFQSGPGDSANAD